MPHSALGCLNESLGIKTKSGLNEVVRSQMESVEKVSTNPEREQNQVAFE
jgi:hypothetical protein